MKEANLQRWLQLRPIAVRDWVAPVCLGGIIYLIWRSSDLAMFTWLETAGAGDLVAGVRLFAGPLAKSVPPWILFSLPAALWSYSIVSGLAWLWRDRPCVEASLWITTAIVLGPASELLQAFGAIPGTFDWTDLFSYAAANAIALARPRIGGIDVA